MNSSKVKALLVVFVLLFGTCIVAVGCKGNDKKQTGWVNTNSMPGQTFKSHTSGARQRKSNPNIVYLGSSSDGEAIRFNSSGTVDLGSIR